MSTTTIEDQFAEVRRRIARLQVLARTASSRTARGSSATSTHCTRRRHRYWPRCAGPPTRSRRSSGS